MNSKISDPLLWDGLADIYKKMTGRTAKTQPMEVIFAWAENQPDKFYVDPKEGTIHRRIYNEQQI